MGHAWSQLVLALWGLRGRGIIGSQLLVRAQRVFGLWSGGAGPKGLGPQSLAARIRIHALGLGFAFVPRSLCFWSGPQVLWPIVARRFWSGPQFCCGSCLVSARPGLVGSSLLVRHGSRHLVRAPPTAARRVLSGHGRVSVLLRFGPGPGIVGSSRLVQPSFWSRPQRSSA